MCQKSTIRRRRRFSTRPLKCWGLVEEGQDLDGELIEGIENAPQADQDDVKTQGSPEPDDDAQDYKKQKPVLIRSVERQTSSVFPCMEYRRQNMFMLTVSFASAGSVPT
jgi:hypothetical protein